MNRLIVVGIDYSMTSPAICIHSGEEWSFANCSFHYVTDKKKFNIKDKFFNGYFHIDYLTQEQRFDNLASWALSVIPADAKVFLEGYAYAAKGSVFNIGENTGVLKHKLWARRPQKKAFEVLAPSIVKKFATGKGNADKVKMHEAFVKETAVQIHIHFGCSIGMSPISDIIDSYYISKCGFEAIKRQ